jgi:hypothetical protein
MTTVNKEQEIWRPVLHHEDDIEVSNHGRIAAVTVNPKTGETLRTIITPFENPCGYLCFIAPAGKSFRSLLYVHELAGWTYTPPFNEVGVRHIDGNIQNNHTSNLECTNEVEERDLYDCGCSKDELEEFGAVIKELSYGNGN